MKGWKRPGLRTVVTAAFGAAALGLLLLAVEGGEVLAQASATPQVAESVTQLPMPVAASTSSFDYVSSIACPSSSACVTAGHFFPAGGGEGGSLQAESSAGWSTQTVGAALPGDAATAPNYGLSSVACSSSGTCTAVGSFANNLNADEGVFLNESDGTWKTGVEVPLPADGTGGVTLTSVSCASGAPCVAVGDYASSAGDQQALIAIDAPATSASGTKAPLPAGANASMTNGAQAGSELDAVSCAAAATCAAVGTYYDSSGMLNGLLLNEDGSGWTATKAPIPADAVPEADPNYFGLTSVSCATTASCAAVGFYSDASSAEQGVLLTLSDGSWTAHELALPADAAANPQVQLNAVTCVSAGNCTAVGSYADSSGAARPLIVTESGGTWSQGFAAGLPADASTSQSSGFDAIACGTQPGNCTAVGFYTDANGAQQGLIVRENGGTWSSGVAAALPANADTAGHANLDTVACDSLNSCTAAGTFTDQTQAGLPFVVRIGNASDG